MCENGQPNRPTCGIHAGVPFQEEPILHPGEPIKFPAVEIQVYTQLLETTWS
jgi:hypothetical protein